MPKVKDAELVEIDKAKFKRQQKREQGSAKTYEELVALGKSRNYKSKG